MFVPRSFVLAIVVCAAVLPDWAADWAADATSVPAATVSDVCSGAAIVFTAAPFKKVLRAPNGTAIAGSTGPGLNNTLFLSVRVQSLLLFIANNATTEHAPSGAVPNITKPATASASSRRVASTDLDTATTTTANDIPQDALIEPLLVAPRVAGHPSLSAPPSVRSQVAEIPEMPEGAEPSIPGCGKTADNTGTRRHRSHRSAARPSARSTGRHMNLLTVIPGVDPSTVSFPAVVRLPLWQMSHMTVHNASGVEVLPSDAPVRVYCGKAMDWASATVLPVFEPEVSVSTTEQTAAMDAAMGITASAAVPLRASVVAVLVVLLSVLTA